MKCKAKFIKLFAVLFLGFVALNLSLTGMKEAVNPNKAEFVSDSRYLNNGHFLPQEVWGNTSNNQASEPPIVYVFRILFILFIISPPLIVLMLVLIWKELRERNRMK